MEEDVAGEAGSQVMLPWATLVEKYALDRRVTGVVHVGAHLAEEAPYYAQIDVPVMWIEANGAVADKIDAVLEPYPRQWCVEALVADVDGREFPFHVTNYDGMSSSIFPFGTHRQNHPDVVVTRELVIRARTLDLIMAEHRFVPNMLVMDVQGAEGLVLKGATTLIPHLDFVYSEINTEEVYKGCAKVEELDALLSDFRRAETAMTPYGWGDAVFVRKTLRPVRRPVKKVAVAEPVRTGPRFLPAHERVNILRDYAKRYGIRTFIESGTSVGGTTEALMGDFDRLWTIELDHGLFERARTKFAPHPRVTCMEGDSGKILPNLVPILSDPPDPILFWLDGHHSGPGSAHGDLDTPIRAELEAAVKAPHGSVILIDDARIFEGQPEHADEPHYHDYPSLEWVREIAEAHGFDYEMSQDIVRLTPRA